MASISGASSTNMTSSLYNSANIISGLASGLDTEGMIESLVQSYQTKIDSLNQKVTKTEWKQDAYRSIIQKMYTFSNKYTSYTSSSNLLSSSFFNSAVKVETVSKNEAYKSMVSASGRTSSDIALNAVHQLASAAKYTTKGGSVLADAIGSGRDITGEAFDPKDSMDLATLNGSMVLSYGSKTVSLRFDEVKDADTIKDIRTKLGEGGKEVDEREVLAELINQKLADQKIAFNNGNSEAANQRIEAKVEDGNIVFQEKGSAGNGVYISRASDSIKSSLGIGDLTNAKDSKPVTLNLKDKSDFSTTRTLSKEEYLYEKSSSGNVTMNLNLDGTTKSVSMPQIVKEDDVYKIKDGDTLLDLNAENYAKTLNKAVQDVFGDKVQVKNDGDQLHFEVKEGSNLLVNSSIGDALGIGSSASTYLNTSTTLNDLFGKNYDDQDNLDNEQFVKDLGLKVAYKKDSNGNLLKDQDGNNIVDTDNKGNTKYVMEINGKELTTTFSKESTLSDVMNAINSESDVKVSYSKTTKNFLFTANETGADSRIEMGDGLAAVLFGTTEPEDYSGKGFGEAYGVSWLDGDKVSFKIPGTDGDYSFGVSKDETIEDVANHLNNLLSSNHGITASYDKYSGELKMYDKNGAEVNFDMWIDHDKLGRIDLELEDEFKPSVNYTPGQDAKFTVTVNGEQIEMTRSSNTVDIDGLSITMKEEFDSSADENGNPVLDSNGNRVYKASNAVTFKTSTDSDKIVDAIKSMIEDYNSMMSEIKSAYSTMPYQTSSGSFANYEPLTEEERQGMSESAIERYEEKAKQGILFGDRNLSNLYDKLRNVFSPAGEDGALLRAMGISISYSMSDGTQAVTLDEDKLRAMLDSEPDKVTSVFAKTTGTGGVMQNMKNVLDAYSKTTGEPKGILVQQAGSPLSSLSLMSNAWQTQIDDYNTQIEKWQDKLSDQVDRYTSQFARLEQLINQMNSQSSALAGMMGG